VAVDVGLGIGVNVGIAVYVGGGAGVGVGIGVGVEPHAVRKSIKHADVMVRFISEISCSAFVR
jgi:hypothetical protein